MEVAVCRGEKPTQTFGLKCKHKTLKVNRNTYINERKHRAESVLASARYVAIYRIHQLSLEPTINQYKQIETHMKKEKKKTEEAKDKFSVQTADCRCRVINSIQTHK